MPEQHNQTVTFSPGPWTVETVLTHLSAIIEARDGQIVALEKLLLSTVQCNDRRYEERFAASQRALDLGLAGQKSESSAALAAAKEAVLKAEAASERRFESVNEFRKTLDDQQRTLIPRVEVDVIVKGVLNQLAALEKTLDASIAERQSQVAALQRTIDTSIAKSAGITSGWGYAAGLIGILVGIFGLASRFWGP